STTTWARRPSRTSWRSASPTPCTSRSGTGPTWTTCRSPCRRTSGSAGGAGYYDGIGAARDVIQNHLLQLMALTAMEEPVSFDADSLRQEKEKVLSAVRLPADLGLGTPRGQYAAGWQGGRQVAGYLEEEGIPADSRTETYAAVRLSVDTRRWAGVPFYLRTGKRLPRRM